MKNNPVASEALLHVFCEELVVRDDGWDAVDNDVSGMVVTRLDTDLTRWGLNLEVFCVESLLCVCNVESNGDLRAVVDLVDL
jgi:hypothetical protein